MPKYRNSLPLAIVQYVIILAVFVWLAFRGAQGMGYNWQWNRIPQFILEFTDTGIVRGDFITGLAATLKLSTTAFMLAMIIGLCVAILRLSGLITGKIIAICLLEFFRNSPLLVMLYVFYYVLGPIFGMDRYFSSVLCLAFYHGVLSSEIFRAGIESVPLGQWEGAKSIGMNSYQTYRHVILPQTFRFILPPLTNEGISLIKSSAIVGVIAVVELTTIGRNLISTTYMSFEIWLSIAMIYLIITVLLSLFASRLERWATY